MQFDRGDNERDSDEAEQRCTILDQAEGALPHQQPDDERHRQCPPGETDTGENLERETNSTELGDKNQESNQRYSHKHNEEEREAEPLAHSVDDGMLANCR